MTDPSAPLDSQVAAAAEAFPRERRELFLKCAGKLLHGLEAHPAGGTGALVALATEAFQWLEHRAPGETRIRVSNPENRPGHTVLEVLQDDHPFIIDSLGLVLWRFGCRERVVIHPVLHCVRDESGRLIELEEGTNGEPRESYVYIEFVPPIDDAGHLAELEASVRQVMEWVDAVTDDHRRMVRAVRELNANLEYAGPFLEGGPERSERVQRFLDWIIDGRFVFVGMRRYRVERTEEGLEVGIVAGTGLGMWRDDASSRLARPRRGAAIPTEIREDLEDPRIILISKSHMESRVHRHGRLDRIVVKEHDEKGELTGFTIVVGLFTRRVLRTPGSQIPLLSARLRQVVDRLGLVYGSHDHQAVVTAFDSVPVEVLVGADVDQLEDLLRELVSAASSKAVRLVARTHPRGRMLYAAVLIPREHYREDLRAEIRKLLEDETGASYIDDRTSFVEEGAAIVHCFCTSAEGRTIYADLDKLEEDLQQLCSPWEDRLLDALRSRYGDDRAPELAARYEQAFGEPLRVATDPADAVRDVEALEALAETGEPQFALWFDRGDLERETCTLRLYLPEAPLLSDVLPAANHFGLQVVDAQLFEVEPTGLGVLYVESLRLLPLGAEPADLDAIAPRLSEALRATLTNAVPDDALNELVLVAGLDWRQVDVMRSYLEYLVQIQGTLSRPYLVRVLLENPLATRTLVHWFEARFDPALDDAERDARDEDLSKRFQTYRDRITALNEDRALQSFYNLIEATVRTNFFAPRPSPHRTVLKLDSARIEGLTGVIPYREIFVHSAHLIGLHLRGGAVARGGLRWSDRHDDLRVEILGLMSTQMLKNCIIVPVGAKGGFVVRGDAPSASAARAAADEQYRVFVASLLDVTDNLSPDGDVIPPEGVYRRDGDDPYLVVAADKGTAHLSDTANEIAVARDFWLGDAFASGGSEGYDHKKYGITARGAWECVLQHFAELGIDPDRDTYTVAGIGDMSGDVFGNGLLLMRRARLLAAFDHRHVFLDPDPDPEASWNERKRLFELPRSSWDDYSRKVLSEGGGVWPRGSKSIPVPEALRDRLGLGAHASGQELVRAILGLDVDLLWNGGIGTYVKASHETAADAGDRANDAVRIDAPALRARVIGEGGNLGLTQAARVEAALHGVRLDTDAIDNSAGVDLSDHEVNFKIALAPLVRSGSLDAEARRTLLFEMADAACESVLAHNRGQAVSISLDELRSQREPEPFLQAIDTLCGHAGLSREELDLPDAETVAGRASNGIGLTRPELAVLLGLAKLQVQVALCESDLVDSAYLDRVYESYFPEKLRSEHPDALSAHRLRREITALRIVNRLVDAGGATLFTSLPAELGVSIPAVAAAVLQAEDVLRIPEVRARLLAQAGGSRPGAYAALVDLDEGVRTVASFLVHAGATDLDEKRRESWQTGLDVLLRSMLDFLSPGEQQHFAARRERLESHGIPGDLALPIAALPLADRGLNILHIVESMGTAPVDTGRVYARLGDETGINWVYDRLSRADPGTLWDRMVLVDLRRQLLDLQRVITGRVLERSRGDLAAGVEAFLREHAGEIERVRALQQRAASSVTPSTLLVVTSRLRDLGREEAPADR